MVLIVCMVVFYGIYRIMLLTRLPQYGMLRAIGMKRKQLTQMVLLELYEIFFISVPVGTALGIGAAWLILRISGVFPFFQRKSTKPIEISCQTLEKRNFMSF